MINKILPVLILFLVSCSAPNPPANKVKPKFPSKNKSVAPVTVQSTWNVMTYPGAQEEKTARKYVKFETDGNYSDSTVSNGYLHAVIIVDKANAGILLHETKKSNPAENINGPVHISVKNPSGNELVMISSRG